MARGLAIVVDIGAKIGTTFNSTVDKAERKIKELGRAVKASSAGVESIGARGGFGRSQLAPERAFGPFQGQEAWKPAAMPLSDMAAMGSLANKGASGIERMAAGADRLAHKMRVAAAEAKADQLANEQRHEHSSGILFEGAMGLFAVHEFLKPAEEYQLALTRMGNTAKVYGPALDDAGRKIRNIGQSFGIGASEAVDGAHAYISAGFGIRNALDALPTTFKFSATTGLAQDDTARAGVAVMHNMGVEAKDLGRAFDVMTEAQKHGKIQAKDMAEIFPSITASAQKLGITGVKGVAQLAAMLEQVRFGTNDTASAATNLRQLLEKLASPTLVKSMKKIGVDLPGMWKKAKAEGKDYLSMVLDAVSKVPGGVDNPFVLGRGVGRDQARNALTSLIRYREELKRTQDQVLNSAGVLDRDYKRVLETASQKTAIFTQTVQGLQISLALNLLPALSDVTTGAGQVVGAFGRFVQEHPKIAKAAMLVGGALIGLRVASVLTSVSMGFLNAQLLAVKGQMLFLGGGIVSTIAKSFAFMRNTIAAGWLLTSVGGFRALGVAILGPLNPMRLVTLGGAIMDAVFSPLGIAALVIAAAVGLLWLGFNRLKNIGAFFGPFGKAFMKALGPMAPALKPVGDAVKAVGGWFEKTFGPISVETWAKWGEAAGTAIGGVVKFLLQLGGGIVDIGAKIANMGHGAPGGGGGSPPHRAGGGAVTAGKPYVVGERGEELFIPNRTGTIIPHAASAAFMASLAASPAAYAAPGAVGGPGGSGPAPAAVTWAVSPSSFRAPRTRAKRPRRCGTNYRGSPGSNRRGSATNDCWS